MNPDQRERFRESLLRVLDTNGSRFGLGAAALATLVSTYGFNVKPELVIREIEYMEDNTLNLVVPVDKKNFSTENQAWKISATGRNFLADRGY